MAVAYAMKKKQKKMADGGEVDDKKPSPSPSPSPSGAESAQSSMRKAFKFAEGGQIKDNYQSSSSKMHQTSPDMKDHEMDSGFMGHEGNVQRPNGPAMSEEHKKLNQHMVDMMASTSMSEQDIVDRIMQKREESFSGLDRYSKGGKVANDTGNGEVADEMPNQFDDLVLRDDLESGSNGPNNGDNLGNKQEDEDQKDIVSRIMSSRRKKDRMPNPA